MKKSRWILLQRDFFLLVLGYSIVVMASHDDVNHMFIDKISEGQEHQMKWVYFNKLYRTKFQAGCLAKRLVQDGWIYGFEEMREVEIFRSRKGKYGVRFIP
ncbi:hypothetical protein [Paenibacillus bouchesdurhonensis]|uniref:hypothetical protein n=1 Tax=Paenibacillus bouchesdurhonensis TaxID=1870990 RepID=UPI000DA61677|nr:hypothetical protein [Paenibacillus bouchesdurhonensis]